MPKLLRSDFSGVDADESDDIANSVKEDYVLSGAAARTGFRFQDLYLLFRILTAARDGLLDAWNNADENPTRLPDSASVQFGVEAAWLPQFRQRIQRNLLQPDRTVHNRPVPSGFTLQSLGRHELGDLLHT